MIKTITLDACIEKRVRGNHLDEIQYDIESIHQTSAGIGIKVSRFLKAYGIDSYALIMAGSNIASFVKQTMQDKDIACTLIETPNIAKTNVILIDEYEVCDTLIEDIKIEDAHLTMFASIIEKQISEHDVIAFEYNGNDIQIENMNRFYQMLHQKSEVQICDIAPKYWGMMKTLPANVLVVDELQCCQYLQTQRLPLSKMIELVQQNIAPLAKIVIFTLQFNDMLIFVEGNIYRVVCSIKNKNITIHKEAVLSGIIKCYNEDGDLKRLSEECMCMSVGVGISEGLYIPNQDTIDLLKEKVNVYSL